MPAQNPEQAAFFREAARRRKMKGRDRKPKLKRRGNQGERLTRGKEFVIVSRSGRVFRGRLLTTFSTPAGGRGAIFTGVR